MKKGLLCLFAVLVATTELFAQELPYDPELRKGVLDNGMTYYIRHNDKPAGQAEFWIMHNVGAVQEEDSQQGLAHFLEHMAFNGTKNFPGKSLINWLESIGVKFGNDLNAFTSQEFTCYEMSNVPLARESIIDSCLLVLHDWSYYITLDGDEIDEERGVIIEELRQGYNADKRLKDKEAPLLYGDNRYTTRNIIGHIDGLKSFSHDELRNFYHHWYRTDQQAIMIVGDFDVDMMEQKVKQIMSDIPAVENPEPKQAITIADNEAPIIGIFTDPEQTGTVIKLIYKSQPIPREYSNTVQAYTMSIMDALLTNAVNNRLSEMAMQPDAPFTSATFMPYNIVTAMDMLQLYATTHDGASLKAFEALYTEMERIARFGFTSSEFEVVKAQLAGDNQAAYDGRNDRTSKSFIMGSYLMNFSKNDPAMDVQTDYDIINSVLAQLTPETFNSYVQQRLTDHNQVVFIEAPENTSALPTITDIENIIGNVQAAELEGNADEGELAPLLPSDIRLKGSKVKKTEEGAFGSTIWTLRNGVRVIVKPTDFKADEILLMAYANGGRSVLTNDELLTSQLLPQYFMMAGLGQSDAATLRRQLAGKNVGIQPQVSNYSNSFVGTCSPRDLETMFQLFYLAFTQPRFDRDNFDAMMNMLSAQYLNLQANPQFRFTQERNNALYGNSPRRPNLSYDNLGEISYEKLQPIFEKLYGNTDDFTFTITGNVDLNELRPLVEKYLGSLPRTKKHYTWVDDGVRIIPGRQEYRFEMPMEQPKVTVYTAITGPIEYNLENKLAITALSQLLSIRYTAVMREEKGGTYVIGTAGFVNNTPVAQYQLLSQYDTNPEKLLELRPDIVNELQRIADNGANPEDLTKVKEFLVKSHATEQKDNSYWMNTLHDFYNENVDMNTAYNDIVNSFTPEYFRNLAARIIADGNIFEVIMDPTATEAE